MTHILITLSPSSLPSPLSSPLHLPVNEKNDALSIPLVSIFYRYSRLGCLVDTLDGADAVDRKGGWMNCMWVVFAVVFGLGLGWDEMGFMGEGFTLSHFSSEVRGICERIYVSCNNELCGRGDCCWAGGDGLG